MKQRLLGMMTLGTALLLSSSCKQRIKQENIMENKQLTAVQFRIARPTNKLQEMIKFYHQALGMQILGKFEKHAGYDGVMLGMPGKTYHLEFTQHIAQTVLPKPTKENLLVFYYDEPQAYKKANERVQALNIKPVEPENPYWKGKSETYEDPEGWRVILFNGVYNP